MKKRIVNLDAFRCFAILFVIYFHVGTRFFLNVHYEKLLMVGRFGVEMFFVLSGFLIANLYYKKEDQTNLLTFWLQRFLRTYPPYIVALIISFLAVSVVKHQSFNIGYLFFFQNFYAKIPFFLLSWSLCVEEHFYLVFPLIMLVSSRLQKNKTVSLLIWIVLCLAPSVLRYFLGDYRNEAFGYDLTASIFRFDGIALGCLLSFIINKYDISIRSNKLVSLFLLVSFVLLSIWLSGNPSQLKYSFGYFVLILSTGALLLSLYLSNDMQLGKNRLVKQTALMAYSLYLTHALVLNACDSIFSRFKLNEAYIEMLISLVLIFIVGIVFYYVIEKKSIDLRNKLLHSGPKPKPDTKIPDLKKTINDHSNNSHQERGK
jgi:peptidoglycan/LPS O-acetylase OafA/YrhL